MSESIKPNTSDTPLLERLQNHIAGMAPHQKERLGGTLLVQAAERICQLERELNAAKAEAEYRKRKSEIFRQQLSAAVGDMDELRETLRLDDIEMSKHKATILGLRASLATSIEEAFREACHRIVRNPDLCIDELWLTSNARKKLEGV